MKGSIIISNVKKSHFPKANKEIKAKEVRFVDENGDMIGVMSIQDALSRAERAGLDLVEISPQAEPPVCKLLDFGKFKYEAKKKVQEAKKKQKVTGIKEMKFRPNIGLSDFDVKVRNIIKFLEQGDKVKVSLWFKGREIVHNELGLQLFHRIIEATTEVAKVEVDPKMEGKQMMMMLAPAK